MNRKSFIRNSLMALCVSVLPKNLLPSFGEVEEEKKFVKVTYESAGVSHTMWSDVETLNKLNQMFFDGYIARHKP